MISAIYTGCRKKNRTHFKLYSELPGSGPAQGRHCCSGSAYKTPDFKESIETKFVKIASLPAIEFYRKQIEYNLGSVFFCDTLYMGEYIHLLLI